MKTPHLPLESLEKRVLLSTAPFRPALPPLLAPTSTDIADVKNGPMANAGAELIDLYRAYRRFRRDGGLDVNFEHSLQDDFVFKGTRVGVTVRGRGTLEALTDKLRQSGAELIFRSRPYTVVQAYVPIGQLHELSLDPMVATITPLVQPKTKVQGTADNQADVVSKTNQVRSAFGLDGSGVTIGVISDSVNLVDPRLAGSIATKDLPAAGVHILTDGVDLPSPTDEGRAMLELIHDIAPKSSLAFAASGVSQLTFADAIRMLRDAGSDIIVDDIGFGNEPFFQPGVLDQAITDVVRDGAIYLSAAGNSADSGFEAPTNFAKLGRTRFVDFDPGTEIDTNMRITSFGGFLTLQWDNPYNGVVGSATTDLDIYVYDTTYHRLLAVGNGNNLKSGVPLEFVRLPFGTVDIEIRVADQRPGSALPTIFRLSGDVGLSSTEYTPNTRATVEGHSGGADTISVGAVPFFDPSANESFSSFGPVTQVFDANGNRFSSPLTLQKPDISGIDDVNTSFFGFDNFDSDVLPNFSGTSAAAPNVAALVALLKQADPSANQEQILAALTSTATPLNGASIGTWDPQGGFGLVDGFAAANLFVKAPVVHIVAVKPDPTDQAVESIKIVFDQKVSGFDVGDLTLTRDGGPNLLTGAQTVRTTDNGRSYLLRNLSGLTSADGTYVLTLDDIGSGITNNAFSTLEFGASETWRKISPVIPQVPSNLLTKVISSTTLRLRWNDNSSSEDGFTLQRSDDAAFTTGLKTFQLPANTTVFTDTVPLPPGKHYFYRVRAFHDLAGFSSYSNVAEAFVPVVGEVILDNESSSGVRITGTWRSSASGNVFGATALDDLNSGKGDKNVRFTPNLQLNDDYFVYARWVSGSDRATNVPYDVFYGPGGTQHRTLFMNQRDRGGDGWVLLGKFRFEKGTSGMVRIRNFETDGIVSVDAIRFLPANGR